MATNSGCFCPAHYRVVLFLFLGFCTFGCHRANAQTVTLSYNGPDFSVASCNASGLEVSSGGTCVNGHVTAFATFNCGAPTSVTATAVFSAVPLVQNSTIIIPEESVTITFPSPTSGSNDNSPLQPLVCDASGKPLPDFIPKALAFDISNVRGFILSNGVDQSVCCANASGMGINAVGIGFSGTWILTSVQMTDTPLVITTASLPEATVGQVPPYPISLTASGGTGTGYQWTIVSGALPIGFSLSVGGVLSSTGDPAAAPGPFPFVAQVTDSAGNLATKALTLVFVPAGTPTAALEVEGKTLGDCGVCKLRVGTVGAGEPINVATGNVFETFVDYSTSGQNPLQFTRYYNSKGATSNINTIVVDGVGLLTDSALTGSNWRSNFDRRLQITPSLVSAERPDGQVVGFANNSGAWNADSDIDVKLAQSGNIWTLTDTDDTIETYAQISATSAILQSIQARNGYKQTLAYNGSNVLQSVTDSYGRALTFTWGNGLLLTVGTPDGTTLAYAYDASGTNGGVPDRLISVTYSTNPSTAQYYLYENGTFPFALTGEIDENGNRFATWSYDLSGRATSSQHGGGAGLTTIAYDDATGNRTVTNALGQQEIYKFATLQNVPKVVEIDRLATATTAASTRAFTYDANGYLASQTDWNGNLTTYVNDTHGQPTTTVEASGTPQARTTTVGYHPTFHLPVNIVTPGLSSAFAYDGSGELLTKTLTDTTATIVPYSTNGTARTWTYTWNDFLLASAQGPRTDVKELTKYTYDGSGALTAISNALGQTTKITAHTGGGLPLTVVDPNGVTLNLTYDARQRLLTGTLTTSAGPLTATLGYDPAGNLIKTTLPDGSALSYSYDAAHRLTGVTDLFNQSISLTLDANGDSTETDTLNSTSTTARKHSATFDALGRMLDDIGGVGQTTAYAYDANGNALTVTNPLSHVTQQAFDPFNRLIRAIDAAGGITKIAYDPHDRPVTVVDPNSGSTTFVYDGFGDVLQRLSPDTGKTTYRYDLAGNLIQSVDATGATTNYTYDALDRVLTTTYPADSAENVVYTYDEAGHGFGIGRLTSVTDAAGSLSRSYDERGNLLTDKRTHGAATLLTSNTYDAASRVASITYPSGWQVSYTRDSMGRITAANATAPGGATQPIVSGITYQPFGPVNAMAYGNSVVEMRSFDLDYRLLNLTDMGASALQNLNYGYDADDNVTKVTDAVTAANTQSLGYDVLDHLIGGTGNYGTLGYTYSAIGNRLTQTSGGVLTTYTNAPHSNQLATIKAGAATQTLTTTAAGNVSGFSTPFGPITGLTYNQANRLATTSAGASQLTQYGYDAFGQRAVKVGSITSTTIYQYDQAGHLLEENDGQGDTRVDYVYVGDQPVATIQPITGNIYFLHDDHLGTPQVATDASQTVRWAATYQPFGYTSTSIGAIVQNLRLPGQEFDVETGLFHNGFRDYTPALGRYLESDPAGLLGGLNTYSYASGNPIELIDPTGLAPCLKNSLLGKWACTADVAFDSVLGDAFPELGIALQLGGIKIQPFQAAVGSSGFIEAEPGLLSFASGQTSNYEQSITDNNRASEIKKLQDLRSRSSFALKSPKAQAKLTENLDTLQSLENNAGIAHRLGKFLGALGLGQDLYKCWFTDAQFPRLPEWF